jgi:hypothetical protein
VNLEKILLLIIIDFWQTRVGSWVNVFQKGSRKYLVGRVSQFLNLGPRLRGKRFFLINLTTSVCPTPEFLTFIENSFSLVQSLKMAAQWMVEQLWFQNRLGNGWPGAEASAQSTGHLEAPDGI